MQKAPKKAHKNNAYRNVARVVGKIGKAGEVKVEPIDNLPFLLREGMEVYLTPPELTGIRSSVIESVGESGDAFTVKFADSNSSETAFSLVGRTCLVCEADLDEIPIEDDPSVLIGMSVEDAERGYLGDVTDLIVTPEQITLIINARDVEDEQGNKASHENSEPPEETGEDASSVDSYQYMIPFVDEFIEDVDEETIYVSIPDSLANLNR